MDGVDGWMGRHRWMEGFGGLNTEVDEETLVEGIEVEGWKGEVQESQMWLQKKCCQKCPVS